ncbi:peptide-N(4)-(N-acetyl-beta-glucosaminyl)asparagine amidase [Nymphalis io]|uniref:peptide-N(4)-(N-acetyl-beta- glucosaminyl)asparagine amidase n=1 Tax=Inachis io TaxID=171585 RepID=UPI0021699650|nr:peptide-N(4)-(N-acetyl-beta-glucosaminyl)asparagine amidase [Nymphalis io]
MEDMARLALVEQNVKDTNKFNEILQELLQLINYILDNPHENEIRTIKSDTLKKLLNCEAFSDYLKYIGFQTGQNEFTFPKEQTLNKLRVAQAALERKISFCYGPFKNSRASGLPSYLQHRKKVQLTPADVLETDNQLLLKIQTLFNDMIKYEDEELQQTAREHIPLVTLQLMALDRMREQQRKIKTGELKGHDMSFDIALLMELLGWFKHKFFTWVDQPPCDSCGGSTRFVKTTTMKTETETCRVELYKCVSCGAGAQFPRYNEPRTLLRTRRGRCGEWANCFTLLCRALGYDTRYVYDTTDHVWCEVFDYESNGWLHVDPCEGTLNSPLMYSHGWGKKLTYVIALSRDDLQDVTWRYTNDHKEVLRRRAAAGAPGEAALVAAVLALRARRHAQLTAPRRAYLAARTLRELVDLMRERKPTDYESHGRISGSKEWRTARGESGAVSGHVFEFEVPGEHTIQYSTGPDRYRISSNGTESEPLKTWTAGVFQCENVFRKVEKDWKQAYLAREEGEETGSVSWKIATEGENLEFDSLAIKLTTAVYEDGKIDWTIQFDNDTPIAAELGESTVRFPRRFRRATLRARLRGGRGDVAWQHAQLFRQPLDSAADSLDIRARLVAK